MYAIAVLLLIAQAAPGAPPAAKAKAQVLLTEASTRYTQGDYAGALEKFTAAYETYPSPKLLFNIGQANRDLSRPVEALEAFEKYLATEDDAASPTIGEAKVSLEELHRNLGRVRVLCETAGVEIRLDGKSAGSTPLAGVLWATPGRHQVTASRARSAVALEDVDVKAGVLNVVTLHLQPLAAPSEQISEATTDVAPSTAPPSKWTWTWVAAGSTVLLGAGAIVAGLSMQSKYDSLNASCGSGSTAGNGCLDSDISAVTSRRNMANVLWGLAGAAAVTTGFLFYWEGRPVTVVPTVGVATGAVARTTF